MRFLLDTHTFIWFVMGDPNLPKQLRTLIETIENERVVSIASLWEIAIKMNLGKLNMGATFEQLIPGQLIANRMDILPVSVVHLYQVAQLPLHHRDPFDRMLIAQCLAENLPVLSRDATFDRYAISRLWA